MVFAKTKSFWKRALNETEDFLLWLLHNFYAATKETINAVAEEFSLYLRLVISFVIGVALYIIEGQLPISAEHHQLLSLTGLSISFASSAAIVLRAIAGSVALELLATLLEKLGLLDALRQLRDKVLRRLGLQ